MKLHKKWAEFFLPPFIGSSSRNLNFETSFRDSIDLKKETNRSRLSLNVKIIVKIEQKPRKKKQQYSNAS